MMKLISALPKKDLQGKKILVRVDFNIPVLEGNVAEKYRLRANKEIVDFLAGNGAIVALASHITAGNGFEAVASQIKDLAGFDFKFLNDCVGETVESSINSARPGDVFLLDNLRKYGGEESNDLEFARQLVKPFDIYVNNAFSVSHRNHASVTSAARLIPSYAGPLLVREIENLTKVLESPKEGKTLIVGGAKVETKFPVIKNFLDKAENVLIGGVSANVFLKAKGIDIGRSETNDDFIGIAGEMIRGGKITVPDDFIIRNGLILDIGPKTVENFSRIISGSKMVIWNGPLGKTEIPELSHGSRKIAEAIVGSQAFSVIGGGDTTAFMERINLIEKVNYVSTGGGAMFEFLTGNKLPGVSALENE